MQDLITTIQNYDSLKERIIHISKNIFEIKDIDLEYIVNIEYIKIKTHNIKPYSLINYEFKPSDYLSITFLEDEMYSEGKTESYLNIPFYFFNSTDEEIISYIEEAKEEKRIKDEEYISKIRKENEIKHREYIIAEHKKLFSNE